MKLCPICDSQMSGNWCKSCHRFVTPIVINTQIRLNAEHDMLHDDDCDFHGDDHEIAMNRDIHRDFPEVSSNHVVSKYAGTTANTPVTVENARAAYKTQKVEKVKKGKSAWKTILTFYLCFILFGWILTAITDGYLEKIVDAFEGNPTPEPYIEEFTMATEPIIETEAVERNVLRAAKLLLAMKEITKPVDAIVENGNNYSIYDAVDIEKIGFCCDIYHFEEDIYDLESFMHNNILANYIDWDNVQQYEDWNYVCQETQDVWAYFNEQYYYQTEEALIIVDADTATKQIHEIDIVSNDIGSFEFGVAAFELLNRYVPGYYATLEDLRSDVYSRIDAEDIIQNGVRISFDANDGEYTVRIQPY